jgi:hypothetical protein
MQRLQEAWVTMHEQECDTYAIVQELALSLGPEPPLSGVMRGGQDGNLTHVVTPV